ncbi:embryonic growth/differentiation factor 1 isoform X2 [Pogoniulus pusillus]|uniref:embryonic growth/differentiation factor 1 isoform X2 n=1 Tax=Pogoniulus pusillus TaxID=488313 RepID=UPI0030B92E1D
MWLLPSFRAALAWVLLSLVLATELSLQESLLLKSLGLSAKPSPKAPIPVPSVLWRIFQKRRTQPAANQAPGDGCRVEEFNVPGNIIRVFGDRGHFLHEEQPQGLLCLQKLLYFNLSVLEQDERLTMAQLERRGEGLENLGQEPGLGPGDLCERQRGASSAGEQGAAEPLRQHHLLPGRLPAGGDPQPAALQSFQEQEKRSAPPSRPQRPLQASAPLHQLQRRGLGELDHRPPGLPGQLLPGPVPLPPDSRAQQHQPCHPADHGALAGPRGHPAALLRPGQALAHLHPLLRQQRQCGAAALRGHGGG